MTKIFKQLARHWAVCLVVFALLFVQAYCDLALPDYTSKIVDTGIQQGGIESPLPQTVRQSTLDALSLLMSEEDAQKLQNAYQYYLQDDGVLQLRSDLTEDERTALEEAVTTPDIVLYMAAAQAANTPAGQNSMGMTGLAETPSAAADADTETVTPTAADLDTVCSQFAAMSQMPGFDRSMLQKQLDGAMSQLDSTLLENLKSQSLLLVQLEYEAQGVAQDVQMGYLFRVGGQMLALTLLMVAVAVAVGFLASRVSAAIGRDLRRETFSSVIGFSNAEIENFSTASLITRTTNDIQQVQFVCVILLRMVAYAPILGIGGVLHVVGSSSGLSWIVVLDVALLLLLLLFLMSVAMPKFKVMQQLVDRLNLVSREILTGIMPVRAFSREKFEEQRFDKANRELMGTQLFTNRAMVAMMPFMTLIMNGTSLLIVWFGGKAMDAGTMQVGEMIAFITYTMQIVMSFLMLAMVAVMLPRAGVAADRIDEVIRTKATIRDPDEAAAKAAQAHTGWQGVVQFEDVSFRYPGADSDALEHISFTAKPGETTAIIGSTGCGKSTLLNLIPRFYDVTGGKVTVDGIDVREMPQAQLHDLLGYVPQKGVLFSGTIDSNLKFGGEDITDAQVHKAAAIAQATDFIEAKSEGYQSPIAQGGSNVSGGQKQRLSIARAIAKNPKVYLFDDSFSALDYKTDVTLRRALKAQTDNATVIIVAQRISTVLHANQILVLDEGKLVGKGTHAQLMVSCPEYQEIARSQLSQKELALDTLNTEKEGE
ncbi:ABC transporter ATP-binding protein [Faecalibacterium prausnitzii]|uniref:ABC transporter ATP-binding protein n=1 Tax=Faecalibacterium prausnitzii TaxID=853 RepID=UPI001C2BC834|nr:ABC transporter ATP-binding protein [Faecalibacterium prausnitzii]MBV0897565.1 ABC transporter ATP-binding protein/permease [Faecalibacterium prausnitzii]MCQ5161590.1 ABC transporter ATP-binding protein/permease [Faecalibacterium prausnitzii]MCQ5175810.1 ABC transporter ATP-binding protein/permease [Faecalibacterium prausnitzii]